MARGCAGITEVGGWFGATDPASFYTRRRFYLRRAKFLAVKEDFMLLAVGIISTSVFVLNPEHWKQVQSFLNKLALRGGGKKTKRKLVYVF